MIPLFKPYVPSLPRLNEILLSGNLGYGEETKKFEICLKDYFKTEYLMVTNTFMSAIITVLLTRGIKAGDEVICSPMGCLVSTQPYLSAGLKIVWADIDPTTGTLSPESVKSKITSKTKAIVHNHYCGYVGHVEEINKIAKEYNLTVIDDGIECFGSLYKDKKIGNVGTTATIFSLGAVRIPNTIDGGVVIFNEKQDYERALLIRDCGIDRSRFRDELGEINPKCDISEVGLGAMMSNVNGYIGQVQMESVQNLIQKQRENAKLWDKFFEGRKEKPLNVTNGLPNYWVYGVLTDDKIKTIKEFRSLGYYASGVHINNNYYSAFGEREELLGVNEFYSKFVALPCGWWVENVL